MSKSLSSATEGEAPAAEKRPLPELLAPAGDLDCVRAALACGADAVYLGAGNFHARAKVGFGPEELREAVRLAKLYGAEIYLTLNTLVADEEVEQALQTADLAVEAGVRALIVQDLGLALLFRRRYPEIELHASTQMGIHNVQGARMLRELGFQRVILARETPISEIRKICREIETEVFVQGALCVSFSGNCYLSSSIFSASGNRGKCLQPCRKKYLLKQGNRPLKEGYLLSMSDLCLLDRLEELKEAGVRSLKIEGRLRRKEYVAGAVTAYRRALDGRPDPEAATELKKLFNRGDFTLGHAFSAETNDLISADIQGHKGIFWARIERTEGQRLICSRRGFPGDGFKVFRKRGEALAEVGSAVCEKDGELAGSRGLKPGDLLFLTSDQRQLEDLRQFPKPAVDLRCRLTAGRPAELELSVRAGSGKVTIQTKGAPVQPATGTGLTEEQVRAQLCKLNDTLFQPGAVRIDMEAGLFLPVSALNALRRQGVGQLECALDELGSKPVIRPADPVLPERAGRRSGRVILFRPGTELPDPEAEAFVLKPFDLAEDPKVPSPEKTFLYLPAYTSEADLAKAGAYLEKYGLCGIWADQLSQVRWAEARELPYYCGLGMNVFNGQTAAFFQRRPLCRGMALSQELNRRQLASLTGLDKVLLYAYGRPEVMTLRHCPVRQGYGTNCADCRYREGLSLTDEKGVVFPFSRMKMSDCTFFLHNSTPFSAFKVLRNFFCGLILDFTFPEGIPPEEVLAYCRQAEAGKAPAWPYPGTSGNLNRGV